MIRKIACGGIRCMGDYLYRERERGEQVSHQREYKAGAQWSAFSIGGELKKRLKQEMSLVMHHRYRRRTTKVMRRLFWWWSLLLSFSDFFSPLSFPSPFSSLQNNRWRCGAMVKSLSLASVEIRTSWIRSIAIERQPGPRTRPPWRLSGRGERKKAKKK